jgi:hypothetical protein
MASMADRPRAGNLYSLLAAVVLITAPHVQRLPVWVSAFVLALIGWRALTAQRDWPLPSRWLLAALALLASAGVILSYGPLLGRDASVALLAVMVALKCMELRSQRDANVVICLGYFLTITNFLYSQSIATAAFMLIALMWLTATGISLQDRARALQPAQVARAAGMLLLQAVPLMLVLFVLFPRVQGPVFGFPQATSTGITGLSESMSPGDLASLGLSDEVAFRVDFHTPAPSRRSLLARPGRGSSTGAPGAWVRPPRPVARNPRKRAAPCATPSRSSRTTCAGCSRWTCPPRCRPAPTSRPTISCSRRAPSACASATT